MLVTEEEFSLMHYGILRRSGRYPWGSGKDPEERGRSFLNTVDELKKSGMSESDIAKSFSTKDHPFTTTHLRALKTVALATKKQSDIYQAQRLKDKGESNVAIGKRMGINESSVRALLAPGAKDKASVLDSTTNMLRNQIAEKTHIDIGSEVERSLPLSDNPSTHIGISKQKLSTAVAVLQEEGYKVRYLKVRQLGTGQDTNLKVLSKPGSDFPKVADVKSITDSSKDGGLTFNKQPALQSVSSKRLGITYGKEGAKADGVIYIRPGTKDLDLGSARYAQVRIAVDGTHYLKGMAMYKTDLPEGKDLVFNTNKSDTGNKLDALKELAKTADGKIDKDNPFTATIKAGGRRGALNIVNEEGDWDKWARTLSSQVLSKQSPDLAAKQLKVDLENRVKSLNDIRSLTNPTVRKKLLDTFSDEADSASVALKAAALPRTAQKVLLPFKSIKDNEIYAPTFRDGERVVLIRHPHAGPFEIPELTVNNKNAEAKKALSSNAIDAVGINHKVAAHLSGADFDGDHVLVIPNNSHAIKIAPALEGLKNFDPQSYKLPKDSPIPRISPSRKQQEMGKVSNLIADMTIHGANSTELARAVRHSMVVIDSEKHELDYKASAIDNGIAQLKEKYQSLPQGKKGSNVGASTLITRAGSRVDIPARKPRSAANGGPVDKATGKKVYEETGEKYVNRQGKEVQKTETTTKLAVTDDAHKLSSGTKIESVYADHSNALKSLANEARKESVNTTTIKYSPSAKAAYHNEVASLNAKLNIAKLNAPVERAAQRIANTIVSAKRAANPDLDADSIKKIKNQALAEARSRTGAKKQQIEITQSEWNAIQAGAISNHKLSEIITNADLDTIRKLATPRDQLAISPTKISRALQMIDSGYTQSEVADALGISVAKLKIAIQQSDE